MRIWHQAVGHRPIVTRLVLAVAAAMTLVLSMGSAFVFWEVDLALSRQLDRDLKAYREVVESAIANGRAVVSDTPGQSYQIYLANGDVAGGTAPGDGRMISRATVREVLSDGTMVGDVGHLFVPDSAPYRYIAASVETPDGQRVVAYVISRANRDEALRELMLQLAIVGVLTLAASSYVGYRTARGVLNPVERFRVAAAEAGEGDRLPIGVRDDELNRLGATFNALLDRVAESADRERRFISDAAHELRSPLAVMRADVEWALLRARSSAQDDAVVESLTSMRGQVDRLVALCNMLLELEELRATPDSVHSFLALEEVAAEVVDRWRERVRAAGRELVVVGTAPPVRAHQHWLEVALGNLISNALRYGAGTITVTLGADERTVTLAVTDGGEGFPDDFAERAFDRFARADDSRASGGTGLGLAIVAGVAELHRGRVTIRGAEVRLDFPRAGGGASADG